MVSTVGCIACKSTGLVPCESCGATGKVLKTITPDKGKEIETEIACSVCAGSKTDECSVCDGIGFFKMD